LAGREVEVVKIKKRAVKKSKIKAIIFDVGGVLQKFKLSGKDALGIQEYLADKMEIALDSWFDAIDTPYGKSFIGEWNDDKVISMISENLGISKKKLIKLYEEAVFKHFEKNKELYKIVLGLKKKNYLIGILSDQWALSARYLISKEDRELFDVIVLSNEAGIRKPDIKIYKLLFEKLKSKHPGIKPSEILFIDNREYNLKPAQKLGMKVILFEDNKQCIKELNRLRVFV